MEPTTNGPQIPPAPPQDRPRVSVILSAWNRERFLPDALRSIDAQGLDPTRDEVILNSNLPTAIVREVVGERPVRVLSNDREAQGAFYAAAVRSARGEVLAFLDDDDRWAPGRIAAVRERFERSSDLAYFHNEQRHIDGSGAPIERAPATVRLSRRALHRSWDVPGPVRDGPLQALLQRGAFFNLSSTCVRADRIAPFLPYLDRITANDDSFFFYAAVLSGGGFHLDPHPWTDYRVHATNLSRRWDAASQGGTAGGWPSRAVESHAVLLEMAQDRGDDDVRRCIERDLALMQLLRDVAAPRGSRRASGADLLALLQRFGVGHLPLNAGFATLGAAQVVSPALGRFVHARLRK